mmetsp:Transcript_32882/g.59563  ORF Transcript_32882/g.59563 Transcript_32882/m.59563 type:complete len:279 (+) Transcript_32882:1014-1850(+)
MDFLSIRKLIRLLESGAAHTGGHLLLKIKGNVTQFFLNVANDFTLSSGGERVTALHKDLHEIIREIATGKIETENGVRKGITLIDGDSVGNTITGIEDDTGSATTSVKRKDGLNSNVHGRYIERLEHDLSHLFSVNLRVKRSLSEKYGMLLRSNTKLVEKSVVPNLLHIIPVGDNTVFNGVPKSKDTTLGLCLITNVGILLAHPNHNTSVTRTTNDGGEHSARSIITGETGLHHTGAVIANESRNFTFVSHCVCLNNNNTNKGWRSNSKARNSTQSNR